MEKREIVYRLDVFASDYEQSDFQIEANTPFQTFNRGDFVKTGNVDGFASDGFHGVVHHVVHYMYGTKSTFFHQTLLYLKESDWWDKGLHLRRDW